MAALLDHFRSEILRRSTIGEPTIVIIEVVGPSEICQLDNSVDIKQDIFGLDVSVYDGRVQRVKILHSSDAFP